MDEIVFIIFGILSVLLIGGVIISMVNQQGERQAEIKLEQSLQHLRAFCDNTCTQPEETLKKIEITLTKNSILYGHDDFICIGADCRRCRCPVSVEEVNLTDAPFKERTYTCTFHRLQEQINISCQG